MLMRRELLMGALAFGLAPSVRAQQAGPARPLWGPPYSADELRGAERRFGIRFPPDLFDFLLKRRFARAPDWTRDDAAIRELLDWPLDGILTDVERNGFWAPHWGPRPAATADRIAMAEKLVRAAPRLIPLGSTYFIPETPFERGNPVLFVFLSDVRHRGANLADFAERLSAGRLREPVAGTKKAIPFWTELSQVPLQLPAPSPPARSPAERG